MFINTKKNADMLGRQLEQAGFPAGVLHGGKTQARNCYTTTTCAVLIVFCWCHECLPQWHYVGT